MTEHPEWDQDRRAWLEERFLLLRVIGWAERPVGELEQVLQMPVALTPDDLEP